MTLATRLCAPLATTAPDGAQRRVRSTGLRRFGPMASTHIRSAIIIIF